MAKQSGLGDALYIAGYDISGDTQQLGGVHGGPAALDFTDITKAAYARLGGLRDGGMDVTVYHNPTGAHPVLSALPVTDVLMSYLRGTGIGSPAACCVAKQVGYDPSRGSDGSLTIKTTGQANGFGLEWGVQLTAGTRTDTTATNGASWDFGAASGGFGAQAYLQVMGFTGTDVTIKLQDSADNSTFADVVGGGFAQVTVAPGFQRIATAPSLVIRRYVRVVSVTSGGFASCQFFAAVSVNPVAVVF